MKKLLLLCSLLVFAACNKKEKDDPAPPTPQQLLLGVWIQTKAVKVERSNTDGSIISKDSVMFSTLPEANRRIAFNADGTTTPPNATLNSLPFTSQSRYVFTPPAIAYHAPDEQPNYDYAYTVTLLTTEELVMYYRTVYQRYTEVYTKYYKKEK